MADYLGRGREMTKRVVEWSEQGLVLSQRALFTLYVGRLGLNIGKG